MRKEIEIIHEFINKLLSARISLYPDPRDAAIFEQVVPKLSFLVSKLSSVGVVDLPSLREDIRFQLHRLVFSLYLKTAPRFLVCENGAFMSDLISTSWTLEYYRIEPILHKLRRIIKGKNILDPMAGSGSDMNLVAAFCQPKSIICADICYRGGRMVPNTDMYYAPERNREMIEGLYNELPDIYKPHLYQIIKRYEYQDARKLTYKNKEFAWVVTHPPFGINYKPGGALYLISMLPELKRVATQGIIFSALTTWKKEFELKNILVHDLTGDVTMGKSKYPSCFMLIKL